MGECPYQPVKKGLLGATGSPKPAMGDLQPKTSSDIRSDTVEISIAFSPSVHRVKPNDGAVDRAYWYRVPTELIVGHKGTIANAT